MTEPSTIDGILDHLNPQQREAVKHDRSPLLIVAGAGTGKTATLVHRVAWLIAKGVDPRRILLLTFTRRSSAEMLRRVDGVLSELGRVSGGTGLPTMRGGRVWGGTFHATAARLLRRFGKLVGLSPDFSIHDRSDSEDLLNVSRTELGFAKTDRRFPRKGTCMSIYSRCQNSREKLPKVLTRHFPWCKAWEDELPKLFDAYVDRKEKGSVLDYDDLLVYWSSLLADEMGGETVRRLFDCVLVDEFQDTNKLQAEILYRLCPNGEGVTVVGDDAQSIYAFRAATVRNILDFPKQYPDAKQITLEQNYRSTQPILTATNAVIGLARERFTKNLWSQRTQGEQPSLIVCEDEDDQAESVIHRILEHRESGIDLRRQAVLFRASHHSILLEAALAGRNIPFHKYGGLKFIETSHVKDLVGFLRLAENPRDVVSASRTLVLLPGIGPARAGRLTRMLTESEGCFEVWRDWDPPSASVEIWPRFVRLMEDLSGSKEPISAQVHAVRTFYAPLLEQLYDNPRPRSRDLEQIEQVASRYKSRQRMLSEITLDPPSSSQDLAGPPHLDEDYLVLSTIHSSKGLEWDAVYVIHAADGNIPSDLATGSSEEIEEERRLFYVALTRAKDWLYVYYPMRYYRRNSRFSDSHGYAQPTRFLADGPKEYFHQLGEGFSPDHEDDPSAAPPRLSSETVRRRTKDLWS